jgi:hypothetical protein
LNVFFTVKRFRFAGRWTFWRGGSVTLALRSM